MSKSESKANDYSSLASIYDLLTRLVFFGRYQKATCALIEEGVSKTGKCFIPGVGTGHLLSYLLELGFTDIIIFEPSEAMNSQLMKRFGGKLPKTIKAVQSLEQAFEMGPYENYFFHYYLDLFSDIELGSILSDYRENLVEGGRIHLADFRKPVGRNWKSLFIKLMIWFFVCTTRIRITSLADIEGGIERAGFQKLKSKELFGGLIIGALFEAPSVS